MSDHERERLSAYLDGELGDRERAALEAHLAGCSECRALLERLGAVQAALPRLPAQAPPGYFDDFAARVRGRIEATRRQPPRRMALPGWTWAAAAALLLAVLTPLTLHELPPPAPRPRAGAAPSAEAERAGGSPAAPAPAAVASKAEAEQPPGRSAPEARATAAVPMAGGVIPREAQRRERRESRDAAAPVRKPDAALAEALSAEPEVADRSVPGGGQRQGPTAVTSAGPQQEAARVVAAPPPPAPLGAVAASVEERSGRLANAAKAAGAVESEVQSEAQAKGFRMAEASGGARKAVPAGVERETFRRLSAEEPRTLEGWRALRESWRAFVRAYPDSPSADEARVRLVEAGGRTYDLSADEQDGALLRRDADDYLRRADARQKQRVERSLGAATP